MKRFLLPSLIAALSFGSLPAIAEDIGPGECKKHGWYKNENNRVSFAIGRSGDVILTDYRKGYPEKFYGTWSNSRIRGEVLIKMKGPDGKTIINPLNTRCYGGGYRFNN